MTATSTALSARDLFAACYADKDETFDYQRHGRILNFRVTIDQNELRDYCELIGGYNEFNPQAVADALEPILAGYDGYAMVEIGREGSPVIYIYAPPIADALAAAGRSAHADEAHVGAEGNMIGGQVRLWWD